MSEAAPTGHSYDLYSQLMKNDPYPVFGRMRQDDPVFSQPGFDGTTPIWFLTRYDDLELVLRDDLRFVRDQRNARPPEQVEQLDDVQILLNNHMLNKDGAEHRRLRNLVSKAFTPGRVKALRPRIQAIAQPITRSGAGAWSDGSDRRLRVPHTNHRDLRVAGCAGRRP